MVDLVMQSAAMSALRVAIESYAKTQDNTWITLQKNCFSKSLGKGEILYNTGAIPTSFGYVYSGLLRAFTIDENGNEYSNIF